MSEAAKYRKRPVVIEAMQYDGSNGEEVAAWCGGWRDTLGGPVVRIATLEGDMAARIGDWIIRGVKGEFYPCKPDIFAATYEPVQS